MIRPKGFPLKKTPYKVIRHGKDANVMVLNNLTGAEVGNYYYQEKMENGIILLIPEKIIQEENNNK